MNRSTRRPLAATLTVPRRRLLALALHTALAAPLTLLPRRARAALPDWLRPWSTGAFAAKGEVPTLAALGFPAAPQDSDQVQLEAPDIAESGAVVPVRVLSRLPGTRRIVILALDNPNTLSADFRLSDALAPRIATRIKLGGTTTVVALVECPQGLFSARQLVKVTQGGCGG